MICPRCGAEQADAAECRACGVVVAKARARQVAAAAESPQQAQSSASGRADTRAAVHGGPGPGSGSGSGRAETRAAIHSGSGSGCGGHTALAQRRPPLAQRLELFQQLARLQAAAVPLDETLQRLRAIAGPGPLGAALAAIERDVAAGETLPAAMARQPAAFDEVEAALVAAALRRGDLAATSLRLADRVGRHQALAKAGSASFGQPLLVASAACLLLPLPTLMTGGAQAFVAAAAIHLAALAAIAAAVRFGVPWLLRRPWLARPLRRIGARLPPTRRLVLDRRDQRLFETLALALDTGLAPDPALVLAARATGEPDVVERLRLDAPPLDDAALARTLATLPGLDGRTTALLDTAARTGTLAQTLMELAQARYEAWRRGLRRTAAVTRGVAMAAVTVFVALGVIEQFQAGLGDPLAMLPAGERADLQRELEGALRQLSP